ncbi:hypothetical protein FB451DRAFT_1180510 [Mycena latifolia]|nr:hypothetical protein FB451DRAFT_1180510 [Mycena latifolia]
MSAEGDTFDGCPIHFKLIPGVVRDARGLGLTLRVGAGLGIEGDVRGRSRFHNGIVWDRVRVRQKQNNNSGQAVGKKGKNKWKEGRTQRKREHARGQAHSTFITSSATRKVAHRTAPSEVSFTHRSRQLGCSRQREMPSISRPKTSLHEEAKENTHWTSSRGTDARATAVCRWHRGSQGARLRSSRAPRAPAALAVVHLVREQQDSESYSYENAHQTRHEDIGKGREGITHIRRLAHRHPRARVRAMHSARQLVVTPSAPQQSLLTSSACTTRAPREVPRQRARAHRVEAARRAPRREARAFGTGAGVHVVTHVRRARAHGGEPQRAEHLIEECEHAREAVGMVPRRAEFGTRTSTASASVASRHARSSPSCAACRKNAARSPPPSPHAERVGCTKRGSTAGGKDDDSRGRGGGELPRRGGEGLIVGGVGEEGIRRPGRAGQRWVLGQDLGLSMTVVMRRDVLAAPSKINKRHL